ncbi:MAG: ABC transporter permease [Phycisphaeraceae bacterium]|nr:ABC transporter permease [Phycisphaeraceae bacterium]
MAMNDMSIVVRSLRARLFSTCVTVLSVGVAVALMLNLLAMRDASRRAFERGTGNMDMVVTAGGQSPLAGVLEAVYYARAPQKYLTWAAYRDRFATGDRRIEWALPVQQGDSYRGMPTMAVGPGFFSTFEPVVGEPFRFARGGPPAGTFDVVLGAIAARATGADVGDSVAITHGTGPDGHSHDEHPYKVAAVLEPTGTAHDRAVFITLDSTWIIHADDSRADAARKTGAPEIEPTAENLTDEERKITGVYLRCRDGRVVGQVFAELRQDPGFTAALVQSEIRNLWGIVGSIDRIVVAIAAAVLVSSGIGILLALYNSMEQRRRQIAVLRVLGASQPRIFSLVLSESAVIGLLGAGAGVVLGFVGVQAVSAVLLEDYGLVVRPDPAVFARWALIVTGATMVLACLAGIIPAARAYATAVSRNLRPLA